MFGTGVWKFRTSLSLRFVVHIIFPFRFRSVMRACVFFTCRVGGLTLIFFDFEEFYGNMCGKLLYKFFLNLAQRGHFAHAPAITHIEIPPSPALLQCFYCSTTMRGCFALCAADIKFSKPYIYIYYITFYIYYITKTTDDRISIGYPSRDDSKLRSAFFDL